jgi:hypothetical protein
MKLNKKAIQAGFLVALIIVLTSFVLIAGTVFRFMVTADDKQAETLCKDSIALRAATALSVGGAEVKTVPPLCQTIDTKIKGDVLSIQTQIADKMAKCWEMMGEGRYPNSIWKNINIGGTNQCFICYTLLIEESGEFSTSENIPLQSFEHFIRTTPYRDPDNKRTYLDYIQYGGGSGRIVGALPEKGITARRGYAVAFKAKKGKCSWCSRVFGVSGGIAAGGIALLALPIAIPVGAVTAGAAAVAVGTGYLKVRDIFTEADIDTIMLVDMGNSEEDGKSLAYQELTQKCDFIEDIAGK